MPENHDVSPRGAEPASPSAVRDELIEPAGERRHRAELGARIRSRLHWPNGMEFSKLPVSSKLGLFVVTNTVSRRKQAWTGRLLRTSQARNAISRQPSALAQAGPLLRISMPRVPPSDSCLSRD